MKIEMRNDYKNEMLRDGCIVGMFNYAKNKSMCLFKEEYKDSLMRSIVYMIAIFIFLYSIIIATKMAGDDFPLVIMMIQFFPIYLIIVSPFIFNILKKFNRYKKTMTLYELLCNRDSLTLKFEEFEVKLCDKEESICSIYYSDLVNIEFYESVILFKDNKNANTFFISSEYKDELLSILKKINLLHLIKKNESSFKYNVEGPSSIYVILFILGCNFIPSFTSKIIFQILIGIIWLIFLIVFSIFIFRLRIKKLKKIISSKDIDGALKYCDALSKKSRRYAINMLYNKAYIYLFLNDLDESFRIIEYLDSINNKNNTSFNFDIKLLKFVLHLKKKDITEANEILRECKDNIILSKDDNLKIKKDKINLYNTMKNALCVIDSNSKEELETAEKYFLNKLESKDNFVIYQIFCWELLMNLYKKINNKSKAKEYEDLIKDNIGDFYTFLD